MGTARCRHRKFWLYSSVGCSSRVLWCYECGAIRSVPDDKRWTRPAGIGGENPAMKRLCAIVKKGGK